MVIVSWNVQSESFGGKRGPVTDAGSGHSYGARNSVASSLNFSAKVAPNNLCGSPPNRGRSLNLPPNTAHHLQPPRHQGSAPFCNQQDQLTPILRSHDSTPNSTRNSQFNHLVNVPSIICNLFLIEHQHTFNSIKASSLVKGTTTTSFLPFFEAPALRLNLFLISVSDRALPTLLYTVTHPDPNCFLSISFNLKATSAYDYIN